MPSGSVLSIAEELFGIEQAFGLLIAEGVYLLT